jgi:small subunit ribosomal protein S4e
MTRTGESKHIKRTSAPKFWKIHRKEVKFTVKPSAGPHAFSECIPLLVIIRDILHFAITASEAKRILHERNVKVDGVVRKNIKFPLGLMDVLEIPKMEQAYRIIAAPQKGLVLHPIEGEEQGFKLCRIENKTVVNGGHIQLNLHDGRNIVVRLTDPKIAEEDVFKTKDVLKISIPDQEILEHIKFEEGCYSLVIAGRNLGLAGKVTKIEKRFGPHASTVTLERDGKTFQTALEYAFPIGDEIPIISLPD